jgi:hypothetical protein
MNTSKCPIQGDCGGTGWLWRGGSDYPYPEPPEWYPCKCNPRADGDPNQLLDYGWRSGAKRWEAVTPPEPF